ncbi:MAG: ABC transporter ATP-binding protein [Akkermansiaceae bacterium]|nr:ABC transporter ATP-binding protein [Akkermansiaceae bacterium]
MKDEGSKGSRQDEPLLEVRDLICAFETEENILRAVDEISFTVPRGKTMGIVGESGCGKSVTAMSLIRLLPQPSGLILGGSVMFDGEDLTKVADKRMHQVRGGEIGVIFQEPMTALNPAHRVGRQIAESILLHKEVTKKQAWEQAVEALRMVRIPSPELRAGDYPHQLSGGMRQRVVIAMALACRPKLLIADEPTTALDVTVQAQILDLIQGLQDELGMSMLLITHDLGVVAETCDEMAVMYAGRIVERGTVEDIYRKPRHAYTQGLFDSIPRLELESKTRLNTIPGSVGSLTDFVHGCRFCQRMGREGPTLKKRPPNREIAPGHIIEACPICADGAQSES